MLLVAEEMGLPARPTLIAFCNSSTDKKLKDAALRASVETKRKRGAAERLARADRAAAVKLRAADSRSGNRTAELATYGPKNGFVDQDAAPGGPEKVKRKRRTQTEVRVAQPCLYTRPSNCDPQCYRDFFCLVTHKLTLMRPAAGGGFHGGR